MTGRVTKQSSKEVEWKRRLVRFAASGQPVRQFCQAEGVSAASFYRWQGLLSKAVVAPPAAASFIDVGAMPASPRTTPKVESTGAALEVRLELGHGLVLHIVRR